jgi:penicillin-binding protein 2
MKIWGHKKKLMEIHPDEILIDSQNMGEFDQDQFEGRIERPLGRQSFFLVAGVLVFLLMLLAGRAGFLQLLQGTAYAQRAQNNQLEERVLFADRGIIVDRTGLPLAYNEHLNAGDEFARRVYAQVAGIAHAVGYVKSPAKDSNGVYYRSEFVGMDGAERAFDAALAGRNGMTLTETDAHGEVVSQSVEQPPQPGEKITLSIDAQVTSGLHDAIATVAKQSKFVGGAGVVMDVQTGELLALTSYPEYASQALTDGVATAIDANNSDTRQPFLNRALGGVYAPGSIVKPIIAVGALAEGVIDEHKQILSTGSISLPNQYDPEHPSVFKDWRANGWVDVRHAIAISSDVYFYEVGGGYQDQPGLGIDNIDKYFRLFGFGSPAGLFGFTEAAGSISTITWKAENFPGDPWRIGDTYHTAIGQYGTQVTPLQAVREAAALSSGELVEPTLLASTTPKVASLDVPEYDLAVVREGMRLGVTGGIAQSVNFGFVHVAAKTGTAQVGMKNEYLNSWMIGFWPYEHPRYAYAVVLERGPAGTLVGASAATAQFLQWMQANAPQYLQ